MRVEGLRIDGDIAWFNGEIGTFLRRYEHLLFGVVDPSADKRILTCAPPRYECREQYAGLRDQHR